MLKTPLGSIGKNVGTRAEMIAAMRQQIRGSAIAQALSDPQKMATKRLQDIFGADANLSMSIQPISADQRSVYIAGTISASVAGTHMIAAVAAGVTIVKHTVFFYYMYRPYKTPEDIAVLLPVVKGEMFRFIKANGDLDAP